jgi:predicted flap endonuclease-1-like 5' DNA nuclease
MIGLRVIEVRLAAVEVIGETYAAALERAGVSTVEALLEMAGSPAGRRTLAKTTGVTPQRVREWVNRADLMRIHGIGSVLGDLLEAAGVESVRALASSRPDELTAKLQAVNSTKKFVRRTPTLTEVEKWITEAQTLPEVAFGSGPPERAAEGPSGAQSEALDALLAQLDSNFADPGAQSVAKTEFAFRRAILDLVAEAAATFGGISEALAWLKSPNRSIGNATPESLLDKGPEGIAEARAILFRLEEGMFS